MKLKPGYIEVQADTLMYWYGRLIGLKEIKAGAFYPFIFVTNKIHPNLRDAIINHELIHFVQQKELFLIGQWLLTFIEAFYTRIILRKSSRDTYIFHSAEQEAYDHMYDLNYLKNRIPFTQLKKYLKVKPITWVTLIEDWYKKEGFPIVSTLIDEPNKTYASDKNKGNVTYYVIKGMLTFFGGINKSISEGERIDIPAGVEHSAIVGSLGCQYVVAQELKEAV